MPLTRLMWFTRKTAYLILLLTVLAAALVATGILLQQNTRGPLTVSRETFLSDTTFLENLYSTPGGGFLTVTSDRNQREVNVTSYNTQGEVQWITNYDIFKTDNGTTLQGFYLRVLGVTTIGGEIYVGILIVQFMQSSQEIFLIGEEGTYSIMQNSGAQLEEIVLSGHSLYYLTVSEYTNETSSETYLTYTLHRIILSAALLANPTHQITYQATQRISYEVNGTTEQESFYASIFPLGNLANYVVLEMYKEAPSQTSRPYNVFERDTFVANYTEDDFLSTYAAAIIDGITTFTLAASGGPVPYMCWFFSRLTPLGRSDGFVIGKLVSEDGSFADILFSEPVEVMNSTFQPIEGTVPNLQYVSTHWTQSFGRSDALQLAENMAFIPLTSPTVNYSSSGDPYIVVEDFLGFLFFQKDNEYVLEPLSFKLRANYENTIRRATIMLDQNLIATSLMTINPDLNEITGYEIAILELHSAPLSRQLFAEALQIAAPVLWAVAVTTLILRDHKKSIKTHNSELYPKKL